MVGVNQYKRKHELQSRSFFFVVKAAVLYEGEDGNKVVIRMKW